MSDLKVTGGDEEGRLYLKNGSKIFRIDPGSKPQMTATELGEAGDIPAEGDILQLSNLTDESETRETRRGFGRVLAEKTAGAAVAAAKLARTAGSYIGMGAGVPAAITTSKGVEELRQNKEVERLRKEMPELMGNQPVDAPITDDDRENYGSDANDGLVGSVAGLAAFGGSTAAGAGLGHLAERALGDGPDETAEPERKVA